MAAKHYPNSLFTRLRELAARPQGIAREELQGTPARNAQQALYTLTNLGHLHPSRSPNGHHILRWFACPQAAQAHQAAQAALRPIYTPQRRARPAVEARDDTHRRELKAPRAARVPRQSTAQTPRQTAAQAWANTPAVVPANVRITYGNPPQGRMAGLCPADKPPPMRDGAADYQRHMARYHTGHTEHTEAAA
jgi:hypothetical protein